MGLRIPIKETYWTNKGKRGKIVSLYTHDDMDGIFTAIEMKKWLLERGFKIEKYGLLNYSEGWKYTTIDPTSINIVLDFASMPKDERDSYIDFYLDHHGSFTQEELEKYKNLPVRKKKTSSAYEALCDVLNIRKDNLTYSVIDMIDGAKYEEYGIPWTKILKFNLFDIKNSNKKRLEFAANINQFLKRSDTQTIIEVIENSKEASIYNIYNLLKILYPENNIVTSGFKKGEKKDFVEDSLWRINEMKKRTRGPFDKKRVYRDINDFLKQKYKYGAFRFLDGYQVLGDLVFVPPGTWTNALRIRSIIEEDINKGIFDEENYKPKFILLQYGGTLQVCSYDKMEKIKELPTLKNGEKVSDLGKYMSGLLKNFQEHLDYYDPETSTGQDEITVSGGHGGIGSISNIFGMCGKDGKIKGIKYIDIFKNKIISDLSGLKIPTNIRWVDNETNRTKKETLIDNKVRSISEIKKLDVYGKIIS